MPGVPRNQVRMAWVALAAAMAVAAGLVLWLQRGLIFGADEWNWVEISGLGSIGDTFDPYQGHLIALPLLIYKATLHLSGTDYRGFAAVEIVLLSIVAGLVFEYSRRRVEPLLALVPAVLVLCVGTAWTVLLQPMFGIQFALVVATGLGALLALERRDRRGDAIACVLLVLTLASFSQGIAFFAGAAVAVLRDTDRRSRLWVLGIPLVLYGAWRLGAINDGGTGADPLKALLFPLYAADSLAVIPAGIFGHASFFAPGGWMRQFVFGLELASLTNAVFYTSIEVVALVLVVRWARRRRFDLSSILPIATVLAVLWFLQSVVVADGRMPTESRYAYTSAIVLMLVAVDVIKGVKVSALSRTVIIGLALVALAGNLPRFREGRHVLASYSSFARTNLAAVDLLGSRGDPRFGPISIPRPETGSQSWSIAPWREIEARYGSTGTPLADLPSQSEPVREVFDNVVEAALGLEVRPASPGISCPASTAAVASSPNGELTLAPGGATFVASRSFQLLIGRFADRASVNIGSVPAGEPVALRIPPDKSRIPWRVALPASGVRVCALPGVS